MRKYAFVKNEIVIDISDGFILRKVMIYEAPEKDVYLFLYNTVDDVHCWADFWFETLEDAEDVCLEEYKIAKSDWIQIDDPLPFCQDDFIAPIRVKGRDNGQPQWGCFEILVNGTWQDYNPTK